MKLRGTDGYLKRGTVGNKNWTMNESKTDPAAQTLLQKNGRATNTLLHLVL
jgi:hypothetical protein